MSSFKTQQKLLEYLQCGGVIKPRELLPSPRNYAKVNEEGEVEFLNGRKVDIPITIDYWLKADEDVDLILIDSFNRVNSHISKID